MLFPKTLGIWIAVRLFLFYSNRNMKTLTALFLLIMSACTHPISKTLRDAVDPNLTLNELVESPDLNLEKSVMFGGIIVETRVFENRTEVEVIQKRLDSFGYPSRKDITEGRFVFVKNGFLDPEVYSKGRYITGAGHSKGIQTGKIDNKNYNYPLIEASELKLWGDYNFPPYNSSYYPFAYDPFRYFGPYRRFYPFYPY